MGRRRCPSSCGCILKGDNFNRVNSSDLGVSWTVESGVWEILDNELHVTSSDASVLLVYNIAGSPLEYVMQVDMKAGDQGDQLWVKLGEEQYKIQVEWGYDNGDGFEGRLRMWEAVGTTWQLYGSRGILNLKPGQWNTLYIFVGDGWITARLDIGATSTTLSLQRDDLASDEIRLGTDTLANNGYFDDFELQQHFNQNADCPKLPPVCRYFDYPINLPAGDNIDTDDWDVANEIGVWDVATPNRLAVSTDDAELKCSCGHPESSNQLKIRARLHGENDGDVLKIFFNDTDWVEYEWTTPPGDGEIRVYIGGAQSGASEAIFFNAGESFVTTVCVTNEIVTVCVPESCGTIVTRPTTSDLAPTSSVFGIGTGDISGEVYFDLISAQRTYEDLNTCDPCRMQCTVCVDEHQAYYVLLSFTGLVNFAGPAYKCYNSDCEDWNDRVILLEANEPCHWYYEETLTGWCDGLVPLSDQ